ncbi:3-hydroxyisobutyrate dehydrogenase [Luteococcus sp. H138]|uniref:3-hydroxyisobutyrate dehydrogenase n=1 Tax=unclassified Luteococcus TaxID=2639923 RepID=UPI00313B77E9
MAIIGWIGLGNMGGPMTANLVAAGHTVQGFDLNGEAVAAAQAKGVTPAGSIAEAVTGAEVVFTMLPKGDHARAVYLGDDGVLAHAAAGTLLIDSSTIDVKSSGELHEQARDKGFRFVDAPVSGGISGAAAGTLCFMVGGAPEDVAAATAFIEPMAGRVIPTGGPTSGEAAKIVNNMMLFIELQACAEGAVLADKLGLDPKTFWEVASVSSGNCWALQTWYPVPDIIETAAANNGFAATFSAALAQKDIGLAMDAAAQTGVELPAARVAQEALDQLVDDGFADKDCSLIIRNINPAAQGAPQA